MCKSFLRSRSVDSCPPLWLGRFHEILDSPMPCAFNVFISSSVCLKSFGGVSWTRQTAFNFSFEKSPSWMSASNRFKNSVSIFSDAKQLRESRSVVMLIRMYFIFFRRSPCSLASKLVLFLPLLVLSKKKSRQLYRVRVQQLVSCKFT